MSDSSQKQDEFINYKSSRKFAYISFIIFFISPFLALPFIIADIYKRKRGALFCFAMFMGILTYLLLPDWSLDLARYYEGYERMSNYDFQDFLDLMQNRTDYVFYFLFFLFSSLGLKFQVLLFFLSTFNFYVVFYLFDKISSQYKSSNATYLFNFILVFISIGILYYVSATRFVLASSFFLLFLYYLTFAKVRRRMLKWLFLFLSIFTHIGFLIYLPFVIILPRIKNKIKLIWISVIAFIIISIVPTDIILSNLSSFLPGFINKALIYLELIRDSGWAIMTSNIVVILIILIFLLQYYKFIPSEILNLLLLVLLPVLITFPFGLIVYDRYMILLKIIFVFALIIQGFHLELKSRLHYSLLRKILYFPFLLYFTFTIYLYRSNMQPYFNIDNFFFFSILSKTYTLNDIFIL